MKDFQTFNSLAVLSMLETISSALRKSTYRLFHAKGDANLAGIGNSSSLPDDPGHEENQGDTLGGLLPKIGKNLRDFSNTPTNDAQQTER